MPDRLLNKHWFLRWVVPAAGGLVVISFLLAAFSVSHQRAENTRVNRLLCKSVNLNRDAVREILLASIAAASQERDPTIRRQALRLLRNDLELVRPVDCRSLLTS